VLAYSRSMGSVIFIAGARPNFVKIAPLLRAMATHRDVRTELVHTGQHYDFTMSGVFFEQLGIPEPDAHLEAGSATHGVQSGRIMVAFEEYLLKRQEMPCGVVVVGDVNSTMACALVSSKLGIPVAHVEAGLRSFDRAMPEEINRIVTDSISDLLFVSEPSGNENLKKEGVSEERIHYVGNVMIDTLVDQLPAARELDMPSQLGVTPRGYALVTLHRPSNVDDPMRLRELVDLLIWSAERADVIFPIHPRTANRLDEMALRAHIESERRIRVIPPLGYREFLGLMANARVLLTDSGGVQEETTFLGVPCVTLRTTTERPSTITHGTNVLVGDDLAAARRTLESILCGHAAKTSVIPGWDGKAATRIAAVLVDSWHVKTPSRLSFDESSNARK
jgi:UDP-N-acetylglucosamine 2-epimerase (non-hydrolysing)